MYDFIAEKKVDDAIYLTQQTSDRLWRLSALKDDCKCLFFDFGECDFVLLGRGQRFLAQFETPVGQRVPNLGQHWGLTNSLKENELTLLINNI